MSHFSSEYKAVMNRRELIISLQSGFIGLCLTGQAVQADPEDVVLTLTRPKNEGNGTLQINITRQLLMSLPRSGFVTTTIWTNGPQRFDGVWLSDFLEHFDVTAGTLSLQAINDYLVEMPVSEIVSGEALLAYERNGKPMTQRSKGPVWLVYNYDADPAFRTETIYTRSVWQLDRITVSR
ncbi:molybdopterin-dependent oxidoreductase [Roseovarius bejariae]|nr:molybdopterin-dependent oxidoreductase [Roseovarius bejariae]